MEDMKGKVAFVTGVARGQGREHCVALAEQGVSIIGVDICAAIDTVAARLAEPGDLEETVRQVESVGGRIIARQADVRDLAALESVVDQGLETFGRMDIIVGNAGIANYGQLAEISEQAWQTIIDVNLTGVWKTVRAAVPAMIAAGRGGAIVLISSAAGVKGSKGIGAYVASKHGVEGLARTLAHELARHEIRVNTLAPTNVDTAMLHVQENWRLFRPDLDEPNADDALGAYAAVHLLPVPMVTPRDVSNALLFLVSDAARYVTGITLPVDLGILAK
jgi:(+)-trans-carveol dehydrogenase